MEHSKQVELLAECLDLTQRNQNYITDDETLVPVTRYTDEARFEVEKERVFRREMSIAAHSSEVASVGDFVTRDLCGVPAIIVRGRDGVVNAFINVCRHRGATVESRPAGHCKRFVCPYHAWVYDTDGRLAQVRQPDGFPTLDTASASLVKLPCIEAAGLIWVRPTPVADGEPTVEFDAATRALVEEFDRLGMTDSVVFATDSKVWRANWKIIVDGGLESYHFRIAHRDTIGNFFPDNISTFEFVGDHVRTVLPRKSILELADQPRETWNIRDHTHLVYSLAPISSLLVQKSHYELLLMTPLSPTETRIDLMTVVPNPGLQGHRDNASKFWAANHELTKKTLYEDFEIGQQIQRGLTTGANEFFRFARFEGALKQWHQRFEQRLSVATASA